LTYTFLLLGSRSRRQLATPLTQHATALPAVKHHQGQTVPVHTDMVCLLLQSQACLAKDDDNTS